MSYALEVNLTLETLTCGGCGITFGIPSTLHRQYVESGITINCPNVSCPWGGMVRGESDVAKLEKRLEQQVKARRWAEERAEQERRSHIATKGHLTRTRKRVAKGVCPCCKRSFENLRRHMASKHPQYVEEE